MILYADYADLSYFNEVSSFGKLSWVNNCHFYTIILIQTKGYCLDSPIFITEFLYNTSEMIFICKMRGKNKPKMTLVCMATMYTLLLDAYKLDTKGPIPIHPLFFFLL